MVCVVIELIIIFIVPLSDQISSVFGDELTPALQIKDLFHEKPLGNELELIHTRIQNVYPYL